MYHSPAITEEMLITEFRQQVENLVESVEQVNKLYQAHLYGRVFDSKAFNKLRAALSLQSRALIKLRGPSHDPHEWRPWVMVNQAHQVGDA